MIHLHTRAVCDACRANRATVEIDSGFFLCDACTDTVTQFVLNSVTSESSSFPDVNATAASPPAPPAAVAIFSEVPAGPRDRQAAVTTSQPVSRAVVAAVDPGPCGWTSTDLESSLEPLTGEDDGHWPATADPADPVAANFEAEVSALEDAGFPDLPACLDRRNSATLRVAAANSIHVPRSSFSMIGSGHDAIVDAHNSIVRSA